MLSAWSLLSVDEKRDLVFMPTSSASPNWFGGTRPGDSMRIWPLLLPKTGVASASSVSANRTPCVVSSATAAMPLARSWRATSMPPA